MQQPRAKMTYGGEGGQNGRGLVVALGVILLAIFIVKGWQIVESGAVLGPPKPPQRALPDEPLLQGEDALHGDALAARLQALQAAVVCIEREQCEEVADPGRVRARPSLPFRESLRRLQKRAAAEGVGGGR